MRNPLTSIVTFPADINRLRHGSVVAPLFVDLHTSNMCNQKCHGCPYIGTHDTEYMSEKDHFRIVDQFIDFGVKAFDFAGGGEPTVMPYLPRLMEHIAGRGCFFGLITNGVLMSDELKRVLAAKATYVRVSLEASNEEDYRRYKNHDGWVRVSRNITELVAEQEMTNSSMQLGVKFAVGKTLRGRDHFLRGLIYGMKHGADRITFKALTHEPEELSQEELAIEAQTLQYLLGSDARLRSITSYWLEQLPDEDIAQCWLNQMHTVLDHLGNIYICCYYYIHGESHRIGNIFESKLQDIWMAEDHRRRVAGINREICKKVYCKFFHHHLALKETETRGRGYFL